MSQDLPVGSTHPHPLLVEYDRYWCNNCEQYAAQYNGGLCPPCTDDRLQRAGQGQWNSKTDKQNPPANPKPHPPCCGCRHCWPLPVHPHLAT